MGAPYLKTNDPSEARLIPLFHAWGDLLLAEQLASEDRGKWIEGLATRWTIQMAWSCFELACHLALGRNLNDPQDKLSPQFWPNVNRALGQLNPPIAAIDLRQPPWDLWKLVQDERHPFAHLGAGGGRFPKQADAQLAVEEASSAIQRFFMLTSNQIPRWITVTSWPSTFNPFIEGLGGGSKCGISGSVTHANANPEEDTTIKIALIGLDGRESADMIPPSFDWRARVDQLMENLNYPVKGVRVYDASRVYLDEPLLMWGGHE